MRIKWWYVIDWVLIISAVAVVGWALVWLSNADQEALQQAARDFGYNLADMLIPHMQ